MRDGSGSLLKKPPVDWNAQELSTRSGKHIYSAANRLEPNEVIRLAASSELRSIVQESEYASTELAMATAISAEPGLYLAFPISVILDPLNSNWPRERELIGLEVEVQSIEQRREIRDQVDAYLNKIACPYSFQLEVQLIVDEIVTNAIYNAPNSGDGSFVDRTAGGYKIPNELYARLFLGCLGDRLVIGCRDPFGSLKPRELIGRLDECYQKGIATTLRRGNGGAGIGSFMVYERSSSYILGVQPDFATVVCSQVSLLRSERKRSAIPKCLHWFE